MGGTQCTGEWMPPIHSGNYKEKIGKICEAISCSDSGDKETGTFERKCGCI